MESFDKLLESDIRRSAEMDIMDDEDGCIIDLLLSDSDNNIDCSELPD